MVPIFKNVGERSTAKNYHLVSLLSVVSKVFEKLVNNRIIDHLEKFLGLFSLISSMILGFLDQLQIFLQLYLIELLGLLTGLGLLELWHLIYPRLLIGFDILLFFTNFGISGQIFGLISSFLSLIDTFKRFWMARLHKNIQLLLDFLKAPFLVLHFSYNT